ncbi:MAG: ArsR family transcriptional regulator, partial [Granulosicoccus sp.]
MGTSAKITNLLNQSPMTIHELSEELGISRNSTHVQVRKLEAAGIIEKCELRMSNAAGKPAYEYRSCPGSEDVHSTAYKTVLDALITTLGEDVSEARRLEFLENTGRSLARGSGRQPGDDVVSAIQKAVDALTSLGAMAQLEI